MRALLALSAAILLSGAANAKEYALILSESERQALVVIIDAAVKAQGVQIIDSAGTLLGKVRAANEVVPHQDTPPQPQPPASLEGGL